MTVKTSLFAKKEIDIENDKKIDHVVCFKNVSFLFTEKNGCKHNITFSLQAGDNLNVLYLWDNIKNNNADGYLYNIDTSITNSCVITNTFDLGDIVYSAYETDHIFVKLAERSYNVAISEKDN